MLFFIVEAMLIGLIVMSVLCGILMIVVFLVCCYICARRYYIKVRPADRQ